MLYGIFLFCVVLGTIELCYRFQVIDFYSNVFSALNTEHEQEQEQEQGNKEIVLILGDSFSAYNQCYVENLRNEYPNLDFVNLSVPGIGILQQKIILERKLKTYNPKYILYQYYVGNDLTDIRHPINWNTLSFSRNLYWLFGDKLLILQYLNWKLGSLRTDNKSGEAIKSNSFSQETYNARSKTFLQSDSLLLYNQVLLKGDAKINFEDWKSNMNELVSSMPTSAKMIVLLIPHCIQVNSEYQQRFTELGAHTKNIPIAADYPILNEIKKALPNSLVINPLKDFIELDTNTSFYFANDPHLTEIGQTVLAKTIIQQNIFN